MLQSDYRGVLQPIAQSDLSQTPKLPMKFALVLRRGLPSEIKVLIELHQLASMRDV